MSAAQHTPGPWICVPDARNDGEGQDTLAWEIVGTNGRKVVGLDNFHYSEEEVEANARLIAAAPELLAFAQFILRGIASGAITASPFMDMDPNAASLELKTVGGYAAEVIANAKGATP